MRVKNQKILVIDTDIVSAASEKGIHPISGQCRDFLKEIRKAGHYILLTGDLNAEWDRHISSFAKDWFTKMRQKGKVRRVRQRTQDDDLRQKVFAVIHKNALLNVKKDMHLIEAARLG